MGVVNWHNHLSNVENDSWEVEWYGDYPNSWVHRDALLPEQMGEYVLKEWPEEVRVCGVRNYCFLRGLYSFLLEYEWVDHNLRWLVSQKDNISY